VQALNEFVHVARRKFGHDWPQIEFAPACCAPTRRCRSSHLNTHAGASALARDHSLSFHDALIVAAAHEAGCDTLYTEDMQHGRKFGGLALVNPFSSKAAIKRPS
jgi:predicted nucleic acid-binding protein